MSARVYTGEWPLGELTASISRLRAEAPFAILERPDQVDFPSASEAIEPADWPQGRLFGAQIELYWECEGSEYKVRLTFDGESAPPVKLNQVLALDGAEPEPVWYYLWGEDEIAVGGRLRYSRAIPGKGRGQLGIAEYRDEGGRLIFYRYLGLRREESHG